MLYLVTDPCYLLNLDPKNKDRIWNLCINDMHNSDKYEDGTDYTGVQKILSEELGVNVLRVSDTGYGDWVNSISSTSEHIKIVKYKFCADTGMMCVVEINDKLKNYLNEHPIGAIFESDIPVDIHVNDSNSYWFVLEITDKDGFNKLVTSEDADDEEDYFYNDYDSEEDYEE